VWKRGTNILKEPSALYRVLKIGTTYSTRKWHAEHRGSGLLFLTVVVLRFSKTLGTTSKV